jgi:hypothetical protein
VFFDQGLPESGKIFKVKKAGMVFLLVIIYFLTNSQFILGEFSDYYIHFKTLTYGVLLLVLLLALCTPDKLEMKIKQH